MRVRVLALAGLCNPTGVLFAATTQCIQVANGDDGTVRAYRADTLALVTRPANLDDADNMRFDAAARQVYVGYGEGALGVVDSALSRLVASIPLSGHPESFQLETRGNRIFVNCRPPVPRRARLGSRPHRDRPRDLRRHGRPVLRPTFVREPDRVFLAVPKRGGWDAEIRVYRPR